MEKFDLIITRQEENLRRTIDMVKYAESKNLALLTFNTAIMVILCQYTIIDLSKWYWLLPLCFWIISTVLAISSFIPIIESKYSTVYKEKNLIFFNSIGELSNEKYHDAVVDNLSVNEKYLQMLNDQININARIATRKFKIFKLSTRVLFVATIFIYLIELYEKDRESV